MSIANQITRLTTARNAIITALEDKGIDASEHGFEDFAADIDSISQEGGGTSPSGSLTITKNDTYDVTEYAEVIVEVEGEADPEYSILVSKKEAIAMLNYWMEKYEESLTSAAIHELKTFMAQIFGSE